MSLYLGAAAQAEFDAEVKHLYQGAALLNGSTRVRRNVVGSTCNFRLMGRGIATQKPTSADVVPMNITHANVPATLGNWTAGDYTDIFDQAEVNFDEKQELAQAVAGAMGRRSDQIVIASLLAGATLASVGTNIGGTASGFNLDKLVRVSANLTANGVPNDGKRHLAITARGLEQALLISQFSSADYNSLRALQSGELKSFMGFTWHVFDTRTAAGQEGGLSLVSAGIRQGYAWHEQAVGLATGIEIRTEINYIPEKTSWLVNGLFKAGGVVIDALGALGVQYTE